MDDWIERQTANVLAYHPAVNVPVTRVASALTLGFAIGTTAYIRKGRENIYPLAALLIVGESGSVKNPIVTLNEDHLKPYFKTQRLGKPASKEGFENAIKRADESGVRVLFCYVTEYGVFLATMTEKAGFKEVWCDFQDGRPVESTRAKAEDCFIIYDPPKCVTIGCITPTTLRAYMDNLAIEQGVMSRSIIMFVKTPVKFPPMPDDHTLLDVEHGDIAAKLQEFKRLRDVHSWNDEFKLSPDAKLFLDAWEQDLRDMARAGKIHSSAPGRLHTMALRLCIIVFFSPLVETFTDKTVINPLIEMSHAERAVSMLTPAVDDYATLNDMLEDKQDYLKVCDLVDSEGKISRTDVMNRRHIEAVRMDEIEETAKDRMRFDYTENSKKIYKSCLKI